MGVFCEITVWVSGTLSRQHTCAKSNNPALQTEHMEQADKGNRNAFVQASYCNDSNVGINLPDSNACNVILRAFFHSS